MGLFDFKCHVDYDCSGCTCSDMRRPCWHCATHGEPKKENDMKDCKHEWFVYGGLNHSDDFESCKHCGVKRSEVGSNSGYYGSSTIEQLRELYEVTSLLPWSGGSGRGLDTAKLAPGATAAGALGGATWGVEGLRQYLLDLDGIWNTDTKHEEAFIKSTKDLMDSIHTDDYDGPIDD